MQRAVVILGIALGCAVGGTTPPSSVYGYAVEKPRAHALSVEGAPRVLYRGEWAYLVDGRWYYPTASGWVVFREEPPELRRERDVSTEQSPTDAPMPRGPEPAPASPLFAAPYPAR